MSIGDAYRMTLHASFGTQQYMNTLCFNTLLAVDPDVTSLTALADAWKGTWYILQTSPFQWTSWTATQLWGPNMAIDQPHCKRTGAKQFTGNFTSPTNGQATGQDSLPPQCAFVTTLITGISGRRKRGRDYIFGLGEVAQAEGSWTTATMNQFSTNMNTFKLAYFAGGSNTLYRIGVWSERTASGCIPNPNGKGHLSVDTPHPELAFTQVTDYRHRQTVFSQRRRTLGVGR